MVIPEVVAFSKYMIKNIGSRSSHQKCSIRCSAEVFKNFAKLHSKHLFNKVAG